MSDPPPPPGAFSVEIGLASPSSYHSFPRASFEPYRTMLDFDTSGVPMFDAPYLEDEMRGVPSSNLSTTSGSPSTMGSPLSNPGQLSALPDWPSQYGLGMSPGPGIVDQPDCYASSAEYAFHPGFEYGAKPPGFVGELVPELPDSVHLVSASSPPFAGWSAHVPVISARPAAFDESSYSAMVPGSRPAALALDMRLVQEAAAVASPFSTLTVSPASSSPAFASSSVSPISSFSPPPLSAWIHPPVKEMMRGPTARPSPRLAARLASPFFSQSNGHFFPPSAISCLSTLSSLLSATFALPEIWLADVMSSAQTLP